MTEYHILNLGGGVQSTTLYLQILRGTIPVKIDAAIFADTQEEPASVYKHLDWMRSLGGPEILIETAGKLGDDLMKGQNSRGQSFVSIPCYTHSGQGREGMVRRQCTSEYKIIVIERTIRRKILGLAKGQRIPREVEVHQYYGISIEEARRSRSILARMSKRRGWFAHFPLIDQLMSREKCREYLASEVPHPVERSACVFCPYRSDREWSPLKKTNPEGWDRAITVDNALRVEGNIVNRKMDQEMFVHRSCKPLGAVKFDESEKEFPWFSLECEGMCGV